MEQELVVGARVEHKVYGEGVVKEIHPQRFLSYLVQFDNEDDRLHNSCGYAKGEYPNKHMYWLHVKEFTIDGVIAPAPKTESQQLVDILSQLGFEENYPYDPQTSYDYNYRGKKLEVYWNERGNNVCNCKHKGGCIYKIGIYKIANESLAKNIKYFQKKLDKKLAKQAAKPASQPQVEIAIVEEQKVSEPINVEQVTESVQAKLMKLPQINWTNRIANYNMVMEELRLNEFRPSKFKELSSFYYWKYNPDLMVYVDIYFWDIMNDDNETVFSKLTEFGSVDKFRLELAKALKVAPKRFKLKKDSC